MFQYINFGEKHGVYLTDQRLGWTTDTYVFHYKGTNGIDDIKDSLFQDILFHHLATNLHQVLLPNYLH